jgi:hypothetical protein
VRQYVVKEGDSPARIAISEFGCPKCAWALIDANKHKPSVTHPNGFRTFRELRVGEVLNLPDAWFDGSMDDLPSSYYAALPYADGVTPGVGQTPSHQAVVDVMGAGQAVAGAVAADPDYCASVAKAGSAVNKAVHEFKVAWNAANVGSPVPIGTGNLEPEVAAALATVLGDKAPAACSGGAQPLAEKKSLSTGAIVGIGLGVAALVGGVTCVATRKPRRRRRRR